MFNQRFFEIKMATQGKMTNWVEDKMTNPSTLIPELVVPPECRLLFLHFTDTPGGNEHLIKEEIEEKEDKRKPRQLNKAEVNKTKRNKPSKKFTKKKKVAK
ncbi:hypothetical protein AVEN_89543-1 [Araneus ventricosus]|uniref:Uncharacterized protein n=1 Tax=Araneus ventricosus TaxID=182803 RepID=A0A4Y2WQY9_ARAVE|nr:hypothetical protein AVEN_15051-1 [Araneus ventricosus]GBO39926.1 hypothetical protein AVEN_89543-1 [Araneus ventricosus]